MNEINCKWPNEAVNGDSSDPDSARSPLEPSTAGSQCTLVSFGHKNGQPKDTKRNFNLRSLEGPSKAMRASTGLSAKLQKELFLNKATQSFYDDLLSQLTSALRDQKSDPDTPVSFGFGCEEGIHRSVAVVERLAADLGTFTAVHRDITAKKDQHKAGQARNDQRSHRGSRPGGKPRELWD